MEVFEPPKGTKIKLNAFEKMLTDVDSIETMPAVVQKLLQLTSDPDCGVSDIYDLVSSDPALAAKVMKVASSSSFGARAATSLRAALVRVGLADLRKIVMASGMTSGKLTKFSREAWAYSLQVASVAEALSHATSAVAPQDPFLCGLLHEFGAVLMNQVLGKKYREIVETVGSDQQRFQEKDRFGFDHCDLGAMVAEKWQLFTAVELVMQLHHTPMLVSELTEDESCQTAVYAVGLARCAVVEAEGESVDVVELCERLAIDEEKLEECRVKGLARFNEIYSSLLQ